MAAADESKLSEKQTVLLVVGKTGNGKSATGNTILGTETFQVTDASESCTRPPTRASAHRFGRIVTVVDGPGLMATEDPDQENFREKVALAIQQCSEGLSAILFVTKYPNRLTEEERKTMQALKAILGDDVFRSFGIVVFTFGEMFDMKYKGKRTFQSWVSEQPDLVNLLEECSKRMVLFRNSEIDDAQVQELLSVIDQMNVKDDRFTNQIFERTLEERRQLVKQSHAPQLMENVLLKLDLLISGLENAKRLKTLDSKAQNIFLNLRHDAQLLDAEINALDERTEEIGSLQTSLNNIRQNIDSLQRELETKTGGESPRKKLKEDTFQHGANVPSAKEKDTEGLAESRHTFERELLFLQNMSSNSWDAIVAAIGDSILKYIFSKLQATFGQTQ